MDALQSARKAPEQLGINPRGLVPELQTAGVTLTQAFAMNEYLDETRSLGPLPGDALAHIIAMDIHPICNMGVAMFAVSHSDGRLTMHSWMAHFIGPGLAAYEAQIAAGRSS